MAVYDYGRTPDGVFYYAMEYLDGTDLARLVKQFGAIEPSRTIFIIRQVLSSLTEAHEIGLIHRDIKPANVVLTERGGECDVAKVVDFGLVKDLERSDGAALTAAESISGTPLYMAPEAISAPDTVGPAADLYAVAALAYFLVTGTHLFHGATVMEVCAHHLHTEPEPPSARLGKPIPSSLESVIVRGLAKDPGDRFESARAFREELERVADIAPWNQGDAKRWWEQHVGGPMRLPWRQRALPRVCGVPAVAFVGA